MLLYHRSMPPQIADVAAKKNLTLIDSNWFAAYWKL